MPPLHATTNTSGVPSNAFTLHGGCFCAAIKFTVDAPQEASRPLFCPAEDSSGQGDLSSPIAVVCHCNDCRNATTGIVAAALVVPLRMTMFELRMKDNEASWAPSQLHGLNDAAALEQLPLRKLPSKDVVIPGAATRDSFIGYYSGRANTYRFFCTRCGTPFGYHMAAPPPGWEPSLDVYMGCLDRESLEQVRVSRHLWHKYGIDWIKQWTCEGDGGLKRSPEWRVGEFC